MSNNISAGPIVYFGTGRRKRAIARVRLVPGDGRVTINDKDYGEYIPRETLRGIIRRPLEVTDTLSKFNVLARVHGGGVAGQADAIRLGISRALLEFDGELRPGLKKEGLLTRDPREKESKKYGRKRARKGFQWTKR